MDEIRRKLAPGRAAVSEGRDPTWKQEAVNTLVGIANRMYLFGEGWEKKFKEQAEIELAGGADGSSQHRWNHRHEVKVNPRTKKRGDVPNPLYGNL